MQDIINDFFESYIVTNLTIQQVQMLFSLNRNTHAVLLPSIRIFRRLLFADGVNFLN